MDFLSFFVEATTAVGPPSSAMGRLTRYSNSLYLFDLQRMNCSWRDTVSSRFFRGAFNRPSSSSTAPSSSMSQVVAIFASAAAAAVAGGLTSMTWWCWSGDCGTGFWLPAAAYVVSGRTRPLPEPAANEGRVGKSGTYHEIKSNQMSDENY